jgi:serine/threonine protein kinase
MSTIYILEASISVIRLISNHDNIVSFFGYFQSPNGMILELCDGVLSNLIFIVRDNYDPLFMQLETIIKAAMDICQGCSHIHSHSIVHYDLKTANVLFKRTANGIICKIADFGASIVLDPHLHV